MTETGVEAPGGRLPEGVRGIGAASLLSDVGHEIPTSLLPRLLTQTLGAPAAALGIIEGVADGLAGIFRMIGGAASDDPHTRRRLAVGGYATTAVLSPLIGFASSPWTVGILRTGAWAARGLRSPARNALLADAVTPSLYGRAYGFERAMDNLGAIAGPLLALGLVALFSVRAAIMLSIVPGLLAVAAIGYAIKHIPATKTRRIGRRRLAFREVLQGPSRRLMSAIAAFEFGNVAATLLILRATELLTPGWGVGAATSAALWLYVAYNTTATLVSYPGGRLSDRWGPIRLFAIGVALFLLSYATFALTDEDILLLVIGFVLAGAGIGFVETAEHAAVAASAPEGVRGSAFGILAGIQSFGNLASSVVAGIIWSLASASTAFVYLLAWMALSLALVARTRPHLP